MPHLPAGSSYTGIDITEELTEVGKKLFADVDYPVRFITKNVMEYLAWEEYDLVLCKAVLRHLNDPKAFLAKMIEFAKKDALIVCRNTGLSPEQRENTILFFTSHGMTRQEAERIIDRNLKISEFFCEHPDAGYSIAVFADTT